MDTTIGADAARLAGLQIDTLIKYRAGQLSLDHWERFVNLSPEAREDRFGDGKKSAAKSMPTEPAEKFGLLADLGILTMPADYVHVAEFAGGSFPNPTRVLKPGDQLWVRAHKQTAPGTTTSEERMEFLAKLQSYHVGTQGIVMVEGDKKRHQLPKGYWYASFDEKERLWLDAGGRHRVPEVDRDSRGRFRRSLGSFGRVWDGRGALLSFCDPALRPSDA